MKTLRITRKPNWEILSNSRASLCRIWYRVHEAAEKSTNHDEKMELYDAMNVIASAELDIVKILVK